MLSVSTSGVVDVGVVDVDSPVAVEPKLCLVVLPLVVLCFVVLPLVVLCFVVLCLDCVDPCVVVIVIVVDFGDVVTGDIGFLD